jgi:hypothetical protein
MTPVLAARVRVSPVTRRVHAPALWVVLGGVALLALLLAAGHASASHFRGGTLYAQPDTNVGGNSVRFYGELYFRASYFSPPPSATGASMAGSNFGSITFGDSSGSTTAYTGIVNFVDTANDWFGVKIVDPDGQDGLRHTYAAPNNGGTPWLAYYSNSARVTSSGGYQHVNNPNTAFRLETKVNLPDNAPFSANFPPIVFCAPNAVCWIPIPAVDADNDAVHVTWSTGCQAISTGCSTFYQPGPCGACGSPAAATILANNTIRWDTTGATYYAPPQWTYYSTQVQIEDGKASSALEFLITLDPPIKPPTAKFTWTANPCGPPVVDFDASSSTPGTDPISSYDWVFGDPNSSSNTATGVTTSHTFDVYSYSPTRWTFLVTLTVTDQKGRQGTDTETVTVPQPCPGPTASFTWNGDTPCGLPGIDFDGSSSRDGGQYPIVSYSWNFGDIASGSSNTATGIRASHTFMTKAYSPPKWIFTVTLTVTDQNGGTGTDVQAVDVPQPCPPIASFTWEGSYPCGPPTLTFDASTSKAGQAGGGTVVAWDWQFGDPLTGPDNQASGVTVTHTFAARWYKPPQWTFPVTLTVTDSNDNKATITTMVPIPHPCKLVVDWNAQLVPGIDVCGDHVAIFTPKVTGGTPPYQYVWEFGDGLQDSVGRTSHQYATHEKFPVSLSVSDSDGQAATRARPFEATGFVACVPDDATQGKGPAAKSPQDGSDGTLALGDLDGDGVVNALDNCVSVSNPDQGDLNANGVGDACDPDVDGDGILNVADNCRIVRNADQVDLDRDGIGDACDDDVDGDAIPNAEDNCPRVGNADQVDLNFDHVGDACQATQALSSPPAVAKSAPVIRSSAVKATSGPDLSTPWIAAGAAVGAMLILASIVAVVSWRRRRSA